MEYEEEFRKAVTSFGVDFYGKITENVTVSSGNVIFSPMSIYSAMLLLMAGADGGTLEELYEILRIPKQLRADHVHELFGPIISRYFTGSSEMELNLANRLFLLRPIDVLCNYGKQVESCYNCSIEMLTSLGNPETMRKHMNEWVATNTRDKIKELLPPNYISQSDILVLINALYFRGTWVEQFEKRRTAEDQFYGLDGQSMTVQMMNTEADFEMTKVDELDSVAMKLPFRKGDSPFRWDMLILLPNEMNGLPGVLSQLQTPGKLQSLISGRFITQCASLYLPKFNMTEGDSLDVRKVLEKCGVHQIFSGSANLSKMLHCSSPLSKATHKAVIEVDEEGVTAAAATALCISLEACICLRRIYVNRPFFFALLCNSNVPVFMGHVVKPQWQ